MRLFNLLVSTYKNREDDCISELWYLFREIGDASVEAWRTSIPGLVAVKTILDPFEAAKRLGSMASERPWDFRYVLKLTPIELIAPTDLNEIASLAQSLAERKISTGETYRVTVNKRATIIGSKEVIEAVASRINRKVDLKNPDWIVLIEIVGSSAGISVVRQGDVVSIAKILGR
ncbi:MAG: THUMP domain-containing protein [Candidatus Nezhaarchaeota archaeon]|nr:THUMP domain-containing protein [Candidatus Nezhaarchaeota archaeon]